MRQLVSNRRYLRRLKFGRKSKEFYVFDTETGIKEKDGTIKYFLSARPEHFLYGVIYGPNGYRKVIHTVREFIEEFKKKRYKNKIIYAHNAEYDLSSIYGNIYLLDPEAIFNGKFISCRNGNCSFADSFNVLPSSVEKLGDLLGLPKLDLGTQSKLFFINGAWIDCKLSHINNLQADIRYCTRDCEIVYRSLVDIFENAEPAYTIGALSLKIFRGNFLDKTIKVSEHADLFFDATYGGRTEAFKIGDTYAYVYDINSAYPYAMWRNKFPDPALLRIVEKPPIADLQGYLDNYEGMVTARVSVSPSEKLPVLPYRQESRLIFPCGTFTGSWTFPELRYALVNSDTQILSIEKIIYSPGIDSPFNPFIDYYWKKRAATNDEAKRFYYKLFMNNLYGKMLQRARDEYRFCPTNSDAWKFMQRKKIKHAELITVVGGYFLRYENDRIFNHTIAPWGSYVTAYVRCMLHSELRKDGDNRVYCDTDSRAVTKRYDVDEKQLGGWKREEKIITKVRALKDYCYMQYDEKTQKVVHGQMLKGVKRKAKQLDPEANVFLYNRMIRTRESFRRTDNLPPGTFIQQMKVLSGDYLKRTVFKNGDTKPFILCE
jgi:hypothetical protein